MGEPNEIKISYRHNKDKKNTPSINSSETAFAILFSTWDLDEIGLQETFKVIYLDNSNNVKGIVNHSKGGITCSQLDIRIIMATALKSLSVAIILAHNHPSGSLKPSKADILITEKIVAAAAYFDINILDHIIVSPEKKYFSFKDCGLLD